MKKILVKWATLVITVAICMGFAGCSGEKTTQSGTVSPDAQTQDNQKTVSALGENNVVGLAPDFPVEIPFYDGAKVIESDNFNGNNYTVVYTVKSAFSDVLDFYLGEFSLDEYDSDSDSVYYEAFDYGDIFVKGLTIEGLGDGTTVYMTLEDTRQTSGGDEDYSDNTGSVAITYEDSTEIELDTSFPTDIVPVAPGAMVIDCSMVPGVRSGFADFIMRAEDFDKAVEFYADALDIEPHELSDTQASFDVVIDNVKVSMLISIYSELGSDTLIQITVDEQ